MITKFNPRLKELLQDEDKKIVQLGSEEDMKELWDVSNPDMIHPLRDDGYPIDNWFGAVVNENGKARLVSVTGHATRTGKEGNSFAYIGGNKTHPDWGNKGLMTEVRNKNKEAISNIPKIATYTSEGKKRFKKPMVSEPQKHEVIPDNVIQEMQRRVREVPAADTWGVFKGWKGILRR
tara:strand:- start:139 stop:672 length:534 start_codon:yes stop_codon:yes gene_type:complete